MNSFLIALQFLTRLPIRLDGEPQGHDIGRSLIYYPAVGGCLGLLLLPVAIALGPVGGLLPAAIVLSLWVALTGALHLDGLADSADAWAGGLGDRERTLAIMKDPRSGPMGVVAVLLLLMLKFTALERILGHGLWSVLVLAPVLGRTAVLALFLTTSYVRSGGLGTALAGYLPRQAGRWVAFGVAVAIAVLEPRLAVWALPASVVVFYCLRTAAVRRLGGMTGDLAGALIELVECAVLVVIALAA